jgi:hypothetical protein
VRERERARAREKEKDLKEQSTQHGTVFIVSMRCNCIFVVSGNLLGVSF